MARSKQNRFRNGIQRCRQNAGYRSAEALSNQLMVPKGTVESWEQGFSFPRPEQVISLAELLDCSIDALYGRVLRTKVSDSGQEEASEERAVISDLNGPGKQSVELLLEILHSGNMEVYATKLPDLMRLINSSLAQKRGDGRDSAVPAAAV